MYWSPKRFRTWLGALKTTPRYLSLVEYGLAVEYRQGRTLVRLLGAGKTGKVLWDTRKSFCYQQSSPEEKNDVNWLLGMLTFGEEGPMFSDVPEAQSQLQEATALAIIKDKPKKEPVLRPKAANNLNQVLAPPPLSAKARNFLLKDLLLSRLTAQP